MTPRYISMAQLVDDTYSLIAMLPEQLTCVAGISRSGLPVATMISMLLHIPLIIIRQTKRDAIDGGHGWRLNQRPPEEEGLTLVVDDAVGTGNTLRSVSRFVEQRFEHVCYAAVYVHPLASRKPDYWVRDLPWPHVLEWHVFNSALVRSAAFDFDGILCEDFFPGKREGNEDDRAFMNRARPRFLVRREPIPLIVTERPERYRAETIAWMGRWGVRCHQLIMGPWTEIGAPASHEVSEFKAEHYRRFRDRNQQTHPHLFVESDPLQAQQIAERSGGIVVCPTIQKCFP